MNGVEYDVLGKIVAYWLWDQHPGELVSGRRAKAASYPVPADRIIHLFNPQRPGQGRGFTRLAPVIARVRDVSCTKTPSCSARTSKRASVCWPAATPPP